MWLAETYFAIELQLERYKTEFANNKIKDRFSIMITVYAVSFAVNGL
jgi:hypothetical protein